MRMTFAIAAVLALAASPAAAQSVPLTKAGTNLAFTALGAVLEFPTAQWMSDAEAADPDPLPLFEALSTDDGTKAELDLVRKGESMTSWTHHYEARIQLTPDRGLTSLRQDILLELSQSCASDKTAFFQFTEDNPEAPPALGLACGAYLDTLTELTGKGEVAVVVFRRTDAALGLVIERWRGASFDPSAASTWPVSTTVVQQRATLLEISSVLRGE